MKNLENLKLKTSDIESSKVDIAHGREPTHAAYRGAYQTMSNNLKASQTGLIQDLEKIKVRLK